MPNYKKIQDDFKRLLQNKRLSHAYLFFGGNESDRESKFSFAVSLANFIEGKEFEAPSRPLNELFILKREKEGTIGIDSIRSLKNFLYQKPIFSEKRVALIRDSEDMTPEAQNAILKIVEEPPEDSLLIFIARNEESLFQTLTSRLQKIHFPALAGNILPIETGNWKNLSLDEIVEDWRVDEFFESLLADLAKDPVKNWKKLKEVLRRLVSVKQFNTNKRLQLRALKPLLTG